MGLSHVMLLVVFSFAAAYRSGPVGGGIPVLLRTGMNGDKWVLMLQGRWPVVKGRLSEPRGGAGSGIHPRRTGLAPGFPRAGDAPAAVLRIELVPDGPPDPTGHAQGLS